MSPGLAQARSGPVTSRVLVVDDDRRVRDLLEITLSSNGLGVITAEDGEQAVHRARAERPDLVLLDVRLPKKSGLEVCDLLRSDPTDPSVPIILVSASAEPDQRLLAFARGADDYLAKPFSPKELVARIQRLLARAGEARVAQRRAQELERELTSARREARRADEDARREQWLRELATGPGRDLLRSLELDSAASRLLLAVQSRAGGGAAVLLLPDAAGERLVPWALRGDRQQRVAGLEFPRSGEIASLMLGLRRPAMVAELERLADARDELAPLVTGGWSLVVPLPGPAGLEGLVLVEDRPDGAAFTRADSEWLSVLSEFAALAMRNAVRVRAQTRLLIAAAAQDIYRPPGAQEALVETLALAGRCVPALDLPPRWQDVVAHAVAVADTTGEGGDGVDLERLEASDASGLVRAVASLLARATDPGPVTDDAPEDPRPALLLRGLLAYLRSRSRGAEPDVALARARQAVEPADSLVADALASLEPELAERSRPAM